ncbi:hypothetical protein BDV18DRAFT_160984 [Aspergillus unguis]
MAQERNAESTPNPDLEPLSQVDFHIYNRLAEQMDRIHTEFRRTWDELKSACSASDPSSSSSPLSSEAQAEPKPDPDLEEFEDLEDEDFILQGLSFCSSLTTHHKIEERFMFPQLALRMPEFSTTGQLHAQHEEIHDGLVRLNGYLRRCEREESRLDRAVVKGIMEGFEGVLWEHLDREVKLLEAGNMRRYWGVEEVRRLKM